MSDERSPEERLTAALEGRPAGSPDPELGELLQTAGYLRESLVEVSAPLHFRNELGDWLAQPRPGPWWRGRRQVGAAIGLGAAAAIAVGVVAWRRRAVTSAGL